MEVSYYLQAPIEEVRARLEAAGIPGRLADDMPVSLNANVAIGTMTEWNTSQQLQEILAPWELLDEDQLEWPPEYLLPLSQVHVNRKTGVLEAKRS